MWVRWITGPVRILTAMWVCGTYDQAHGLRQRLSVLFEREQGRVALIEPNDPNLERKLEPAQSPFTHYDALRPWRPGSVLFIVGMLAWAFLYVMGGRILDALSTPVLLGAIGGLLAALVASGWVAYRSSNQSIIAPTRQAISHGQWVVVVYTQDAQRLQRAQKLAADYFRV